MDAITHLQSCLLPEDVMMCVTHSAQGCQKAWNLNLQLPWEDAVQEPMLKRLFPRGLMLQEHRFANLAMLVNEAFMGACSTE
tara:strand:+ start:443 stop:688 length:246 start_codon:yes stop_codon:yes gene_type:complete